MEVGKVVTEQVKFTWHIDRFNEQFDRSRHFHMKGDLLSPIFTTEIGGIKTKWQLTLRENEEETDNSENNEKYLGLFLSNWNSEVMIVTVSFSTLSLFSDENNSHILDYQELQPHTSYGIKKFISNKECNKCKIGDYCTIVCTITSNKFSKIEFKKRKVYLDQLSRLQEANKRLERLLDNKKFCDVVFKVEGKEIHAYKNVLSSESSVFEAMFTHNMSESKNNQVEIADITYRTMYDMIKYIYTGVIPKYLGPRRKELYMALLIAADKYCIEKLKCECEKRLCQQLMHFNIFEYLNFSDMHNASYLKEKAKVRILWHHQVSKKTVANSILT